jgi:glycosyltransferase involved in cell wall biosynthesis
VTASWRPGRPLDFVHLTTFYPPYSFGGDAMYVYRLAHALADEGHSVDVVHCVDSYHLLHRGAPPLRVSEHPGVTRHALESGAGWLSPLLTQQTGHPLLKRRRLDAVLSSRRFDVAQFHNTSLLGPASLALPIAGDPVKIYMAHEHWLVCPMHVLFKNGEGPCDEPSCLSCTLRGRRPPQLWRYTGQLQRFSRHVDVFLSPSEFSAGMHRKRGFSAALHHLPYFLDRVDDDWQRPGPRPQPGPYCLFVGRLEKLKGLHHVIPAWARVRGCDLLVVGDGTYGRELRDLAAANPRIRFLGPRTQHELGPLYAHALACIVPTDTYETFGFTIIEALARKTPVVARALGALEEVARLSNGALLFENGDQLVGAVESLQRDPPLARRLGEQGYETFTRLWTREAHLARYFGWLREAAMRKHGRVPWEDVADAPAV